MRRLVILTTLAVALAGARPAAGGSQGFDERCRAAMAPYYAALLASARGDGEGTLRHLIVLRARWTNVQEAGDLPAWARDTASGQPVLAAVSARIDAARRRATARDVIGAHSDLESIRALLRDSRARAGVRTFDDAVSDYHEALERLSGRAGLHHEISLNADDYAAIQDQAARAAAAWAEIASSPGRATKGGGWPALSQSTEHIMATLRAAASARDMDATQIAAEALKTRYFELLALLARS